MASHMDTIWAPYDIAIGVSHFVDFRFTSYTLERVEHQNKIALLHHPLGFVLVAFYDSHADKSNGGRG